MDEGRWRDPAWIAAAHAWIDGRVGERRAGAIEQTHVRPWATVMRVPTRDGDVWFKANDAVYEAALVERLGKLCPDVVPPPLHIDAERGWMLMTDGGETLRVVTAREKSLDRWLDVLPRYATVQLATAGLADELIALGVPDRRLATLPEAYGQLVGLIGADARFARAVPLVAELCAELAEYRIPDMIQHDDLHDAQVFVRDGRHTVLDWGDACVGHPFLTLAVTLTGTVAWGLDDVENSVDLGPFRDAYLRPFGKHPGDLRKAAGVAERLGWACRAVNGHVPGDDSPTLTRLRMFLDGRP